MKGKMRYRKKSSMKKIKSKISDNNYPIKTNPSKLKNKGK
jgi:hypothetical protein